ncbi:MAG: dipeptide/oligopeptide/nickel ABC transporter ATP-binding protein [Holophagales bacterium]|nr:dipeptide/oligopeptide/nickel ABC transporter ATP-binding protein [Holophagales bacterium]
MSRESSSRGTANYAPEDRDPTRAAVRPALEARGLSRGYRRGRLARQSGIQALDDVSLRAFAGEVTAVVGPSGSGKSTLARCLALLERPDRGEVLLHGEATSGLGPRQLRCARRRAQLVPQDPVRSLAPQFTVAEVLAEPMVIDGAPANERGRRIHDLLREVELSRDLLGQRARSLSGGQAQRLALARALATEPRAVILDETLSGLDLSLCAEMVRLLIRLGEQRGLAWVWISHDPSLVSHLADRAIRLDHGKVVEHLESPYARQRIREDEGPTSCKPRPGEVAE